MPETFPHRNDETGELIDVTYYTPAEIAKMLHISRRQVWANCASGRWPHLRMQRRYFLNAEQVNRVIEILTHDPDELPEWEPPRSLGVVINPDEIEGVQ